MPKALEQKLKRQVSSKNWSKKRKSAYVYGTLRKTGWTPSMQKKSTRTYKHGSGKLMGEACLRKVGAM